ncbi:MAG: sigma-70 family RNA polymerase sigma factor [Cyclobacteriaceae bacterium]|nr:sigma-70 family RNA polymerase sigma factor [Cyclobacteriaceae bacterium]MCH8515144.1 sigma-70 family RNA polymerase sigma factor [Cyclobacteriaceae bacterium]
MFGLGKTYTTYEDILEGCKAGKEKAQYALYSKTSGLFYSVALRYLKNEADAQDALSESYRKIFDKLSQFAGDGSFEGWMKRIVVNECLMFIRSHKNLEKVSSFDDEGVAEPGLMSTNMLEMEADDIHRLICDLPLGYRTVLNLYAVEGYGHKEIAEQLGISEGTSKSQLSKARKMLQQLIDQASEYGEASLANAGSAIPKQGQAGLSMII